MRKDTKTFLLIAFLAVIYFGAKIYRPKTPQQMIQELRDKVGPGLDSFNQLMQRESYLYFRIDSLIKDNKYTEALMAIDTSNISTSLKLDYKGQIAFRQGKTRESIEYYSNAIDLSKDKFFKSFTNRAEAYARLKMFDSALMDYKEIAIINYDFDKPIAEIYEALKLKDSAIRYYKLYLKEYPDSISIQKKIAALKNGG